MERRRLKFAVGIAIILAVASWEAFSGFQQSKTYYVTVGELLHGKVARQHIRVGGIVEQGSIKRSGTSLAFRLAQSSLSIPVIYAGSQTLPDTFKDGAQAIVQGNYMANGTFRATEIQAKCASKYQAAPPGPKPAKMAGMGGFTSGSSAAP